MRDFTLRAYKHCLVSLLEAHYSFYSFKDYIEKIKRTSNNIFPELKITSDNKKAMDIARSQLVILRHDVDKYPENSLATARIENSQNIRGTYYFRSVPESWDENLIMEISGLGHEIGYHYECMTTTKGDMKAAIINFEKNLEILRKLVPVNTICMHGSPRSKYDSKELWKHYDYREYGIIGEPYIDTDFSKVAYYTDTGRMWDGSRYSERDKVSHSPGREDNKLKNMQFPIFHTTRQMIDAIQSCTFPQQAMLTFHPQRWTNQPVPWVKEYIWQNAKNMIKYFFINHKS